MHILDIFRRYFGYTINWHKSTLYVLHGPPPSIPPGCGVTLATGGFKYLGIDITPDPQAFYTLNLLPPLDRLKRDVHHWCSLPLSLLGRSALFKMMSLPRFLYILQSAPFPVPDSYFNAIDSEVRRLLWENSAPRIALRKLNYSSRKGN